MYSKNLGRDLTPEEDRGVNALVEGWIDKNVQVKTEDGVTIFRLTAAQKIALRQPAAKEEE